MSDWERRIEALDAVDVVRWERDSRRCDTYQGDHPGDVERCQNDARFLLVMDSDLEDRPLNMFACPGCRRSFDPNGIDARPAGAD